MRSTPQVIGAAHDAVAYAKSQIEIELNGVGDNPIFIPEDKITLTGANYQGSPVSLPMDMISAAVTMICVLSERRRIDLIIQLECWTSGISYKRCRMFSGLMLSHILQTY
jgi:histidine ammonia-lyase